MVMQELPQSTREQQQQQGDRGRVPMALKQELADRLANMDQTEMIGASLLAPGLGACVDRSA